MLLYLSKVGFYIGGWKPLNMNKMVDLNNLWKTIHEKEYMKKWSYIRREESLCIWEKLYLISGLENAFILMQSFHVVPGLSSDCFQNVSYLQHLFIRSLYIGLDTLIFPLLVVRSFMELYFIKILVL
jgi:hypothetical protein